MKKKLLLRDWALKTRKHKAFQHYTNVIVENFKKSYVYNSSQNLMLYYPLPNEINLLAILNEKKNISFPCIRNEEIVPFMAGKTFNTGKYNIMEPTNTKPQDILKLDLVIVPALCVDLKGYRVGYGKGYYDRFIKKLDRKKTKLLSVIWDDFVVDDIEAEEFDEKVDVIVTEKRIIEV